MNIQAQFGDTAKRIIGEAKRKGGRPYAHEIEQGHWSIPDGLKMTATCMTTNKRLFKEYSDWAFLAGYNPLHIHHKPDGTSTNGCWWIFGANPSILPRKYQPLFPCTAVILDGESWIDRESTDAELFHPRDAWDLIKKTLLWKDIYANMHGKDAAASIRAADKAKKDLEEGLQAKLKAHSEYWLESEGQPIQNQAVSSAVPETFEGTSILKP